MGGSASREQALTKAIENQDPTELRSILRDLTPEQIRALIKSIATVEENQCTILHFATWQDNPDILAPILDYADDLELRDGFGWTPLMTAVNRGSKQNVNLLLARGAKIDCDWSGGMSLIADAMNFADTELITILLDHGARVTPTVDMLSNGQDQNAFYLLHYAVDDGLLEIAKILIEKARIPLNTLDKSGWSPLHLAAGHNNIEIVQLLLNNGADVNIRDSQGNTPLAWARELNAPEAINELNKRGAIADKEWHGEKIQMKTAEEHHKELTANENEQNADKFEIEIENSKEKPASFTYNDGLQRQQTNPTSTF